MLLTSSFFIPFECILSPSEKCHQVVMTMQTLPYSSFCVPRARIDGRLHSVGDTVFIPSLGYNGTICRFCRGTKNGQPYAIVIPHDFGQVSFLYHDELKTGSGINCHIRCWLTRNNIIVHDPVHLIKGTVIHRDRPHHARFFIGEDNNSMRKEIEELKVLPFNCPKPEE